MFKFISDLFLRISRILKPILLAIFDAAFQTLMERLKNIATESITKLAATNLSNSEKRNLAFNDIKRCAAQEMITVKDSDINLIIELFVRSLKKRGVIK